MVASRGVSVRKASAEASLCQCNGGERSARGDGHSKQDSLEGRCVVSQCTIDGGRSSKGKQVLLPLSYGASMTVRRQAHVITSERVRLLRYRKARSRVHVLSAREDEQTFLVQLSSDPLLSREASVLHLSCSPRLCNAVAVSLNREWPIRNQARMAVWKTALKTDFPPR